VERKTERARKSVFLLAVQKIVFFIVRKVQKGVILTRLFFGFDLANKLVLPVKPGQPG
jgi:hypothetical protein